MIRLLHYIKNKIRFFKYRSRTIDNRIYNNTITELEFIKLYLKDDILFWDIGSNIGHWIYQVKKINKNIKICAFEPNIELYNYLTKFFKFYANVNLFNVAISNKIGKATFNIHPHHGRSSLSNIAEYSGSKKIEVDTQTIDTYVQIQSQNPDIIKIDVEGFEPEVIHGARQLLKSKKKPQVLIIELENRHLRPKGYDALSLIKEIEAYGYEVHVELNKKIIRLEEYGYKLPENKQNDGNYVYNYVFLSKL